MDEDQYRSVYRSVNQRKCVFEKAINARHCNCSCSRRFNLADREGVACNSDSRYEDCLKLLLHLRQNASFALRIARIDGQLPHANEIRVQAGGLSGLQEVVLKQDPTAPDMNDIAGLLGAAEQHFGQIEDFPYAEIIKAITSFKGRQRPRR